MPSTERLGAIVEEVFGLLDIEDPFDFARHGAEPPNGRMEARLQELLAGRQTIGTTELAMYLRSSYSRSLSLPSWQPLLNASIELGKQRGEPVWDIFYGMIPVSDNQHKSNQL